MHTLNLEAYVEQKNVWNRILGRRALSLLNAEDRQAVADSIDADLSPENLTCDGELDGKTVQIKYQRLTRAAQELLSIDPSVVFYEFDF